MKFRFLLEKLSYDEALDLFDLKAGYTADEVNRKFKRLAMKFHPDRGGSVEKMQDLNDAREVLLNLTRRCSRPSGEDDIRRKEERERQKHYNEVNDIIFDLTKKYFNNFNAETFKKYFKFVFKSDFDNVQIEYSKFFKDCHKNSSYNPSITAVFESTDRSKIIKMSIIIDHGSLFSMIDQGTSLSSDDMQVYYKTELFINGKKQKVAQTLYSESNKKAILIDPEIIFPLNKMEKIASGEKRKGVILKKRDFESLFILKYKGHFEGGIYWIPICKTAGTEQKVYIPIGRYTDRGMNGTKGSSRYRMLPDLNYWFPGGKPANADIVKQDYKKIFSNPKSGYYLCETQATLKFFDEMLNELANSRLIDVVNITKSYINDIESVYNTSMKELNFK